MRLNSKVVMRTTLAKNYARPQIKTHQQIRNPDIRQIPLNDSYVKDKTTKCQIFPLYLCKIKPIDQTQIKRWIWYQSLILYNSCFGSSCYGPSFGRASFNMMFATILQGGSHQVYPYKELCLVKNLSLQLPYCYMAVWLGIHLPVN